METCGPECSGRKRIRLFLIADEALLRASLGRLLALESDFELVGESNVTSQALDLLTKSSPDLVLLECDGVSTRAEQLLPAGDSDPAAKFLIITASTEPRDWARALRLGASGIFLKSASVDRLIHAVRSLADGEMWIDPRVVRMLADRYPAEADQIDTTGLSPRERTVLQGILGGLSNRKIGEAMGLSEGSVKAVVQQLFGKTGVRTRSQLVKIAISRSIRSAEDSALEESSAVK